MNTFETILAGAAPVAAAVVAYARGRAAQKRTEATAAARTAEAEEDTKRFVIGDRAEYNRQLVSENTALRRENGELLEANATLRVTLAERNAELVQTRGELAAVQATNTRLADDARVLRERLEQDTGRKLARIQELEHEVAEQGRRIARLLSAGIPESR